LGGRQGRDRQEAIAVSLEVRLRSVAQVEYDAAADWYESQRPGLGLRFVSAVEKALAVVSNQADRWPEAIPGVREAPVPRWPYCIYYEVHSDHVMVLAVFHTSRNPAVWQSRV
jgi:toxin ParE1/3/4